MLKSICCAIMKSGVQIPGCTHQASHTHLRPQSPGQEEKGGLLELSGLQSSSGTVKSKFRDLDLDAPSKKQQSKGKGAGCLSWLPQAHMHSHLYSREVSGHTYTNTQIREHVS